MDESVIKHLEQPKVGTLKISEAMRIGARLRPQARGLYFTEGSSCALGAAYEGVTGKYHEAGADFEGPSMVDWFKSYFGVGHELGLDIAIRNDEGQTREQIADWLEAQGL